MTDIKELRNLCENTKPCVSMAEWQEAVFMLGNSGPTIIKLLDAMEMMAFALTEICGHGANPVTQHGYGVTKKWERLADFVFKISRESLIEYNKLNNGE